MSKHTPGPWYIQDDLIRGDYGYVADINGGLINEANARLIAAAPELLAALQIAHEEMVDLQPFEDEDTTGQATWHAKIRQIAEAIAKAEGRE